MSLSRWQKLRAARISSVGFTDSAYQPPASTIAPMVVRSIAVLGAGTMGAQIAAHFANADVPALLLDVTADAAREGLKRARALKPDPFFTPDTWKAITTAGFDELARIREADWIIEA